MAFSKFLIWIAEIIIVWAVLFAVQIPIRRKRHPLLHTLIFLIKVFLIPASALLFVAIDCSFSYRHGDLLCALYIALIGDVAASIIECIARCIRPPRDDEGNKRACRLKLTCVLSLLFCLGVALYGIANSQIIVQKTHNWKAEGLTRAHTFVFAADLHTGTAQSMRTLRSFCRQVNKADPEFVILGGDVTDEMTSYDEMLETYSILSEINAPVYFVYGNHDRQPLSSYLGGRTYSDEQLAGAIRGAGIRILSDEYVKISDDLILLGREDISAETGRKAWADLSNPFKEEAALIVADHQPYDNEQLTAEHSVLQLSGHTHAGQLWPLQIIYRLLDLQAYGEFEEPGTLLYVTAGESGWMMPLRTEEHCEWELITLEP